MQRFQNPLPQVTRWAFDAEVAHIHAFNAEGQVLMAIAAPPQFGVRLAQAFSQAQLPLPACSPAGR